MKFACLPVADLAFASDGLPDVEGLPMDVLFPIEGLGPREVFFSRVTCLFWFPMFKVPRVVRLILARKYNNYETKTMIDKTALHNNNERFTLKTALRRSAPVPTREVWHEVCHVRFLNYMYDTENETKSRWAAAGARFSKDPSKVPKSFRSRKI